MSEPINDGGPAFPQTLAFSPMGDVETVGTYYGDKEGLTLRDYFAAKAMQGGIAQVPAGRQVTPEQVAKAAYIVADAMIAARSNPRP